MVGLAGLAGLAAPGLAGASTPTSPAAVLRSSIQALSKTTNFTLRGQIVEGTTKVGAAGRGPAGVARVYVPLHGSPAPVEIVGHLHGTGLDLRFTYPAHVRLRAPKAASIESLVLDALKG